MKKKLLFLGGDDTVNGMICEQFDCEFHVAISERDFLMQYKRFDGAIFGYMHRTDGFLALMDRKENKNVVCFSGAIGAETKNIPLVRKPCDHDSLVQMKQHLLGP